MGHAPPAREASFAPRVYAQGALSAGREGEGLAISRAGE